MANGCAHAEHRDHYQAIRKIVVMLHSGNFCPGAKDAKACGVAGLAMTAVKLASPESVGEPVPGDWGDVLMNTSEEIDFC